MDNIGPKNYDARTAFFYLVTACYFNHFDILLVQSSFTHICFSAILYSATISYPYACDVNVLVLYA